MKLTHFIQFERLRGETCYLFVFIFRIPNSTRFRLKEHLHSMQIQGIPRSSVLLQVIKINSAIV